MEDVDIAAAAARRFLEFWDAKGGSERGFQNAFAKNIGVNQGTVSGWIASIRHGELPKIESLIRLCGGLGITLGDLFPPAAPTPAHAELISLALTLNENEAAYYRDLLLTAARAKDSRNTSGA